MTERKDAIIAAYRNGRSKAAIARAFDVSYKTVEWALRSEPRRLMTIVQATRGAGYRLGTKMDIDVDCMDVVRKNIKRDETIIACMARLVVQYGERRPKC